MDSLKDLSQGPRKGPDTQAATAPRDSFDHIIVVVLTSLLTACGSSSESPTTVVDNNHAPVINSANTLQMPEQVQSVQSLAATDIDGDQLIWSIESGVDSELFSINASGELKFITAPDYENPTDTNIDNIYQVSINVSDGRAAHSELLSIEVLDRLEGRVGGDPLVGARVFLDINTNAKLDANEPQAITSDSGHFIFTQQSPADINAKQIISLGGANKNTGVSIAHLSLVSELPQEGGAATMVTPLTTVLSQITFAPERGAFIQMMGLSQNTTQIYTADPWEGSLLGDAGAQDTQRLNGQLSLLILSLDVLFESEDPIDPLLFSEVFTQQLIANLAAGRASLSQAAAIKNMLYQSHNKLLQEQDFSNQLDAQIFELIAQTVAGVSEIFASPAINPASDFSIALRRAAEAELRRLIKALIKGQISPQSFVQQSAIEVLFGHIQAEGFPDTDGDGLVDILDDDSDNDGVLDTFDAFPRVFSESLDTDTDGIGDNADTDADGDGVPDSQDAFPFNPAESLDTDGDGLGNTTSASAINQNFTVIETAVNDNDARLDAIEAGSTKVVFQGFSPDFEAGDQGLRRLQAACDATFSGAKVCSSEEYANSSYNAAAANLSGSAWLLASTLSASNSKIRDSITGQAYGSGKLSCNGYSGGSEGPVVSAEGAMGTDSCANSNPVACCI